MIEHKDKHGNENMIEGRNAVLEAFRSGKPSGQIICSGRLPGWPGADDCT